MDSAGHVITWPALHQQKHTVSHSCAASDVPGISRRSLSAKLSSWRQAVTKSRHLFVLYNERVTVKTTGRQRFQGFPALNWDSLHKDTIQTTAQHVTISDPKHDLAEGEKPSGRKRCLRGRTQGTTVTRQFWISSWSSVSGSPLSASQSLPPETRSQSISLSDCGSHSGRNNQAQTTHVRTDSLHFTTC